MKRIKSINGYTIYQATTQRDADNYNCHVGSYNIYLSTDIRDFGLTNSYPEWEDEDSLAVAIARCNGSQYAVAVALADELSDSTVQDMDLCLEIERRLESGDSVEGIRDCYDPETGRLYGSVSEAIAAGYEPFMDELSALDSDPYGVLDDSAEGFDPDGLLEDKWYVDDDVLDDSLRQEIIAGVGSESTCDTIENYGIWGAASLEIGNAAIEVNVTRVFSAEEGDSDAIVAEYFCCIRHADGEWESFGYMDRPVTIDWSAADWKDRLHQEMRDELLRLAREQEWNLSEPFAYGLGVHYEFSAEQCPVEPEEETPAAPKQERRSHASYYVIETCDSDCRWLTCTVNRPAEYTDNQYRALFFWLMAERVAFSDCGDDCLEEIVFDGERVEYVGWQPGMLIEFRSCETGEIVYSGSFPEWDH